MTVKRGAPRGNTNRAISEEQRRRGVNTNLSMRFEEWEAFKVACDLAAGHCLDDDEVYKDAWRNLCRGVVHGFIEAAQRHGNTARFEAAIHTEQQR